MTIETGTPSPGLEAQDAGPPINLEFAYSILENLHGQVRLADEKIRGLFSGSALLAAALAVNAGQSLQSAPGGAPDAGAVAVMILRGLLLLAVASSLIAALMALLPRIVPRQARRSLFFYGHIAATDHNQFIAELPRLSQQSALEQVLSQIHVNSVIVQAKYIWTRRAAAAFMAAIVIWVAVQIVEFTL